MTTLRVFGDDFLEGVISSKVIEERLISDWRDFNLDEATEAQKLEYRILERFKEMRVVDPIYSGKNDEELKSMMLEYKEKFEIPDSWIK